MGQGKSKHVKGMFVHMKRTSAPTEETFVLKKKTFVPTEGTLESSIRCGILTKNIEESLQDILKYKTLEENFGKIPYLVQVSCQEGQSFEEILYIKEEEMEGIIKISQYWRDRHVYRDTIIQNFRKNGFVPSDKIINDVTDRCNLGFVQQLQETLAIAFRQLLKNQVSKIKGIIVLKCLQYPNGWYLCIDD